MKNGQSPCTSVWQASWAIHEIDTLTPQEQKLKFVSNITLNSKTNLWIRPQENKKARTVQVSRFYWKVFRSMAYNLLRLNLPLHHQRLQHPLGPSWRSSSSHGRVFHRHKETSVRSQCASGYPGAQQKMGYSPPACGHWRKNNKAKFTEVLQPDPTVTLQNVQLRPHSRGILDTTDNLIKN